MNQLVTIPPPPPPPATPPLEGEFLKFNRHAIAKLIKWCDGSEYVYDIETYPNFFSFAAYHVKTGNRYMFELSPWANDMDAFVDFIYYLHHNKCSMTGFNSVWFDFPVVNFAFTIQQQGGVTNLQIMDFVNGLFSSGRSKEFHDRFKFTIWDNQQFVRQWDLYKIHHFDNVAKATSLKMLEFNMEMTNIQELPLPPGTWLRQDQRMMMREYNHHDVDATTLFLQQSIGHIDLRVTMSNSIGMTDPAHPVSFTNFSDSKIGVKYFEIKMKEKGIALPKKREGGICGTERPVIHFKDAIFDYVSFESRELNCILEFLKATSVTKTKECLNNVVVTNELAGFMNPNDVIVSGLSQVVLDAITEGTKKKLRKGQKVMLKQVPVLHLASVLADPSVTFVATHLHVVLNGFQFDFGTGGIHGSISAAIVRHDPATGLIIIDVDVTSYYPTLAIQNRLHPAHLDDTFCDTYEEVFDLRQKVYTKKKDPKMNKAIKLALNTVYGVSNLKTSIFYDPLYTMSITLNGQLLLCMLTEQLMKIPRILIIQINTDGVTFRTEEKYRAHCMQLCTWWEGKTKLNLENVDYKAMYIRDVNNYIAEELDGTLKSKAAYQHNMAVSGEWSKNFSARIIAIAAERALVHGVSTMETIYGHTKLADFMMRTKVDKTGAMEFVTKDETVEIQRISRYYAAVKGGTLIKRSVPTDKQQAAWDIGDHYVHVDFPDKYVVKKPGVKPPSGKYRHVMEDERREIPIRSEQVERDVITQHCNDLTTPESIEYLKENINYNYYITKANELVDPLLEL